MLLLKKTVCFNCGTENAHRLGKQKHLTNSDVCSSHSWSLWFTQPTGPALSNLEAVLSPPSSPLLPKQCWEIPGYLKVGKPHHRGLYGWRGVLLGTRSRKEQSCSTLQLFLLRAGGAVNSGDGAGSDLTPNLTAGKRWCLNLFSLMLAVWVHLYQTPRQWRITCLLDWGA